MRRGLVRTFQINQLFNALTPLSSLALAVSVHQGTSARWWRALGATPRSPPSARSLLARFRLADVMDQPVHSLAYGKRRLLEIAIALACRPRVLLLDEPVAGVPEGERQEIFETIDALPADVSVLLIEHDMDLVFNFARTVTVLVNGAVFAEGDVATISRDPRVKAVYLGEGDERGPGSRAAMAELLRVDGLSAGYGEAVVVQGVDFALEAGQLARAARPQRHRQDDAAQHADRRDAPPRRHDRARRPRHHRARRRTSAPPPASAGCRRSATSSSR